VQNMKRPDKRWELHSRVHRGTFKRPFQESLHSQSGMDTEPLGIAPWRTKIVHTRWESLNQIYEEIPGLPYGFHLTRQHEPLDALGWGS